MVIGLLVVTAIPTVIGVAEAISAKKQQNASLTKEQEKFNMAPLLRRKGKSQEVGFVVLADSKLYLDMPPDDAVPGHRFMGYYFKYPCEEGHLGMVSTIAIDPPMLNWIYVDRETHALRFGARKDTVGHVIGPWGWSEDERFLTLEGEHDAFVAVYEGKEGEGDREAEEKEGREGGEKDREDDGEKGKEQEQEQEASGRWAVYWDPEGAIEEAAGPDRCQPIALCRKVDRGVESSYVRD
ncbi:hypothetical protein EDB81DRAFT_791481 [Dactylonectria macrodidyma]|uniref:Uncharacterized protein n=1 Tax=Dactylonectria macrodidyma TaxID=307937 RepID=A0A9P9F4G7_9HYPO|nr:hypothetical protein EDB81DRAFT_791481 [Dactylonectria macrodidyma]